MQTKMNKLSLTIVLFVVSLFLGPKSIAQEYFRLWTEGKMPNSKGMKLERIEERERVTQIDVPGMYAFFPSKEENKHSAVLIFPPGGYQKLTYNIAGIQLAKWFNTMGLCAFVVMYRLPSSTDMEKPWLGPLQDAQRAMKLVRANTEKWDIDPKKVGVMGCSAGGHIAASISTIPVDYSSIDDAFDSVLVCPDFQILVSPVISMSEYVHQGSKRTLLGENPSSLLMDQFSCELHVSDQTPPAFIVHASNDPVVNPMNSILYYSALLKSGVESTIHIFPQGGHSIALRNNPGSTDQWTALCEAWLNEIKMIIK